jgi:hypothetical protein
VSVALAFVVVVCAATVCLDAQDQRSAEPPPPSDMVVIDGAKNPELIPEWVVWEMGFRELATIKQERMTLAMSSLKLSDEDSRLTYAAADARAARDRVGAAREHRIRREFGRPVAAAHLGAALKRNILQCRREVLDARDQLLAKLSPEGQLVLTTRMNDARKGIKAYIPKAELDFDRQPRYAQSLPESSMTAWALSP